MRIWNPICLIALWLSLHAFAVAGEGPGKGAASKKPEIVVVYWSSAD